MKKTIVLILIALKSLLYSQQVDEPVITDNIETSNEKPKIGLVLAGGGAWGFAHVGVLRVLEEAKIPISYISGTSIGSIIGSLYAMGYSVDELEQLIHSTGWLSILDDSTKRRDKSAYNKNSFQSYLFGFSMKDKNIKLPSGIVEGQMIDYLLTKLHWDAKDITDFSEFPIPFRCVATDLKSGRPVILKEGDITDSVRASMAIPGVFSPVEIDENILVDGMFSMNLPVEVVKDMGADIVIAVNFDIPETPLTGYKSVTGTLFQSFLMQMNMNVHKQLPLADIVISPDVSGYSTFSYDDVSGIYNRGLVAGYSKFDELRNLSDQELFNKVSSQKVPSTGNVVISSVQVNGVSEKMAKSIKKMMGISKEKKMSLSKEEIEKMIRHIYSLDFFNYVTYRIDGNTLIVDIKEKEINIVQTALEYDYNDNVSLLLNLRTRGHNKINFLSDLSLLLGEKKEIREVFSFSLGFVNLIGLYSETNFTQDKYPVENMGQMHSNYEFRTGLGVGFALSKYFLGAINFGYDFSSFKGDESNILFLHGDFNFDTLNKTLYPDSGINIRLVEHWAIPTGIGTDFTRTIFKSQFIIPAVKDRFSIILGFDTGALVVDDNLRKVLGLGALDDVPVNNKIYVGGNTVGSRNIPFLGYKDKELNYAYNLILRGGLQFQVYNNIYVQIKADSGAFSNDADKLSDNLFYGYGIVGGVITPIGPLEVSVTGNQDHDLTFNVRLGYNI